MKQLLACEINAGRRKWIAHVVNVPLIAEGKTPICIFVDIMHMHHPTDWCETHEQE